MPNYYGMVKIALTDSQLQVHRASKEETYSLNHLKAIKEADKSCWNQIINIFKTIGLAVKVLLSSGAESLLLQ